MAREPLPTVLFLHGSDEMYGADRQLLALVRASRDSCRPLVLLPDDLDYEGRLSKVLAEDGVSVEHGPLPVLRRRYFRPRALAGWLVRAIGGWWWVLRVARRHRARVLVSNSSAIPVGPSVAMLLRTPHVWVVRELVESPTWFKRIIRVNARLARGKVVAISGAVARWLGPVPGRGPVIVYDAVPLSDEPRPVSGPPTAVFVGRLNDWKGWEVFVKAAAIARTRVPGSTFIIAGGTAPDGVTTEADVEATLREVDADAAWLKWLGEVPSVDGLIASAWVVVVPSTRPEPLGNVVLEAMSGARAVIGSDIGGIPEMIIDGETGKLVAPGDVDALAAALVTVLSDRVLAQRYGDAGYARVTSEFTAVQFRSAWSDVLRAALVRG